MKRNLLLVMSTLMFAGCRSASSQSAVAAIDSTSNIRIAVNYPLTTEYLDDLTYSPDGKMIATISRRGVDFWDATSGKLLRENLFEESISEAFNRRGPIQFSPDGKSLLTVVKGNLTITNLATLETTFSSLDRGGSIKHVSQSKDGSIVAFDASNIEVWNVNTGLMINRFSIANDATSVSLSPDGNLVAGACLKCEVAKVWNVASGEVVREFRDTYEGEVVRRPAVFDTIYLANGGRTAVTRNEGRLLKIWDLESGKLVKSEAVTEGGLGSTATALISPNGKFVAYYSNHFPRQGDNIGGPAVLDLNSGEIVAQIKTKELFGSSMFSFSSDGSKLLLTIPGTSSRDILEWSWKNY